MLAYGLPPGELPACDGGMLEKYEYELFVGPRLASRQGTPDFYDVSKGCRLLSSN